MHIHHQKPNKCEPTQEKSVEIRADSDCRGGWTEAFKSPLTGNSSVVLEAHNNYVYKGTREVRDNTLLVSLISSVMLQCVLYI